MRKLSFLLLLCAGAAFAQEPVERPAGTMGIPMLTAEAMLALPSPGQGTMIFNTTDRGFYWYDGGQWQPLLTAEYDSKAGGLHWHCQRTGAPEGQGAPKVSNGTTGFWDLTGNSGTDGSNFLGTTDKQDLRLKVENIHSGRIQAPPQLPLPELFIPTFDHTSFGLNAGKLDGGNANSFFGSGAGASLVDGENNTILGYSAMVSVLNGTFNTAVGSQSHGGSSATFLCTSLGYRAGPTGAIGNATAIGANASVTSHNSLVLGSINGVNGATADVNVGIGTTAPQRALHVSRGSSGGTTGSTALLVVEDNTDAFVNLMTPAANESGILFGNPGHGAAGGIIYNSTSQNGLAFRTNGNQTRAVIDANGRMGVGTTSPATRLDVNGGLTIRQAATINASVGTSTVTVGDNSYLRIASSGTSTLNLSNGLVTGQLLMIESGGGTIVINDNAAVSNCNLSGNRSLGLNDVLNLVWNGLDWIETGFTNN